MPRSSWVLLLAAVAMPAWSQTQQDRRWCDSPTATDDQTIAGCSALIASGRDPPRVQANDFYNRGVANQNKHLYDNAIADYTRAVTIQPDFAGAYYSRGNAYKDQGRRDMAIADYSRAIKLKPDYAVAYGNRAGAYHENGENKKALPDAERSVALAPKNAVNLVIRAQIYEALGRRNDAISDYRAALKLKPDAPGAKEGLARLKAL